MEGKLVIIGDKAFIWYKGDLHTHKGVISKEKLKQYGRVETHKGVEAYILPLTIPDYIAKIKRGPAIIQPRDFGIITGLTGINKESIVVEAGTGSGAMAIMLANIVKMVYSYEKRKDFYRLAKKNIEKLGIKNIVLKNKDIYQGIDEKGVDLVFLDLPQPWLAVRPAFQALKIGGFLVVYTPQISQAQELVRNAKGFIHVSTIQPSCIEWVIGEKILRPRHIQRIHTGFITIMRKIEND